MKISIILVILAMTVSLTYANWHWGNFDGHYPNDYDNENHSNVAWCPSGVWLTVPGMAEWCTNNCVDGNWNNCQVVCEGCNVNEQNEGWCPQSWWSKVPGMQGWCNKNCHGSDKSKCSQNCQNVPCNQSWCPHSPWDTVPGMATWCVQNCVPGYIENCEIVCSPC